MSGAAFAFGPTIDDDASATFFNPAGLGALNKQHLSLGGSVLYLDYRIKGRGIFNPSQSTGGAVVSGDRSIDPGAVAAVPDLYYALLLNDDLTFGVGLNVPFGFLQNFPNDWTGRYQATGTTLLSARLEFALGWEVTPNLRVGGSINVQYLYFDIESPVDAGTTFAERFDQQCPTIVNSTGAETLAGLLGQLGLGQLVNGLIGGLPADETLCGTATSRGLIEPTGLAGKFDFNNHFKLDGFGLGWSIGLQYQITPAILVGVAFRSKVDQTLTGTAHRDNGGSLNYARRLANPRISDSAGEQLLLSLREAATGYTAGDTYASQVVLRALQNSTSQQARLDVTTPATISTGVEINLTNRLRMALNYEWTNWSSFNTFKFFYTGQPRYFDDIFQQVIGRKLRPTERVDRRYNPTVQPMNFSDSARYGIGFAYRFNAQFTLRSGYAYAEPVVDASTMTDRVRVPSGPTSQYTLGATYRPHPDMALDFSLGYTEFQGGGISQISVASHSRDRFKGSFSDVRIFTVGFTLRQRF